MNTVEEEDEILTALRASVASASDDRQKCIALDRLSWALFERGLFDEARTQAEACRPLAHALQDENYLYAVYNTLGSIETLTDNCHKAIPYFRQTLMYAERSGLQKRIASTLGNIASAHLQIGQFTESVELYERSLAMNTAINDREGIARDLSNVAVVYTSLQQYDQAMESAQKSFALSSEIGNDATMCISSCILGTICQETGLYAEALEHLQQSLAIAEKAHRSNSAKIALTNIANVYASLEEFDLALEYSWMVYARAKELDDADAQALVLSNIGAVYTEANYEHKDDAKAEKYLRESLELYERVHNPTRQVTVLSSLTKLYERQERWKECAVYLKQLHDAERLLLNEDVTKRVQKFEYEQKLVAEKARTEVTEELLYKALPKSVAARLLGGEKRIADHFTSASVLFADIVGFTDLAQQMNASRLIETLDAIFFAFDTLTEKHQCEKIKTIGDCYMVVAGLPEACEDHAQRVAHLAFDMRSEILKYQSSNGQPIQIRIGVHCGEVVAGVLGKDKVAYDLWGDTVNTASRMESHGQPGRIHCSEEFVRLLQNQTQSFVFEERGTSDIKGKGAMRTYFLEKA